MSQTNTASAASILSRLGTLAVIPWAGQHPEDGADIPFLMAYSLGDGIEGSSGAESAVLAAAAEIGLPVGGMILDVAQVPQVDVKVLVEGGKAVLRMPYLHVSCPVPDEWTIAARLRKTVYVILASRPWPEAVPGSVVTEEALRAFAGDHAVLTSAAHFLVPIGTIRS
jgi:hypothetical protein